VAKGNSLGGIREDRKAYRFAKTVGPGESDELRLEVPSNSTLEHVAIRIYVGAELDLTLDPYIERARQTREEMIVYVGGGKTVIDGDDDKFDFDVSIPMWQGDFIVCKYANADGVNSYDFAMDIELDSRGGAERWPGIFPGNGVI
jgi:hypothetical protein